MINIYNYNDEGYFRCDECHSPLWEGDEFIRYNDKRYCLNCVQKYIDSITEFASWHDSSYAQYIDLEIQKRIDNNGRKE